jgi:hypothetical protein
MAGLGLELLLELRQTADACGRHAAAAENGSKRRGAGAVVPRRRHGDRRGK